MSVCQADFQSVCLPGYLSVRLSAWFPFSTFNLPGCLSDLSVCLSICQICLSVFLSAWLSIGPSICLSVFLLVYPFAYQLISLHMWMSFCLTSYFPVNLSISVSLNVCLWSHLFTLLDRRGAVLCPGEPRPSRRCGQRARTCCLGNNLGLDPSLLEFW